MTAVTVYLVLSTLGEPLLFAQDEPSRVHSNVTAATATTQQPPSVNPPDTHIQSEPISNRLPTRSVESWELWPIPNMLPDNPLNSPTPALLQGVDFLARSYFSYNQRIQFTGQETTFGVEGVVTGAVKHPFGAYVTTLVGEFYINQPFDRNILVDSPERASYSHNFEIEPLEISQLHMDTRYGNFQLVLGKIATPFGRTYFPLLHNSRADAPFIRTEAILWRETGLLVQYDPGIWVLAAAIVNGSRDRDTNSSKALVSRVGIDRPGFAAGASIKWQDGIGSDGQKMFNDHVGLDFMLQHNRVTLSAEMIYDRYGFRRPGFDPNDITWRRGLYHRELNFKMQKPITGIGYYVNGDIRLKRSTWIINYGEFFPQPLGDPIHDVTTRRGILKAIFHATPHLDTFTMLLIENDVPNAQTGRLRRGVDILNGLQFRF